MGGVTKESVEQLLKPCTFGKVSVDRNQLKTTDEELALEFGRLMDLFRRVFSSHARRAKMQRRLDKARADGLSWVEALEYAAELTVKPDPTDQGSKE